MLFIFKFKTIVMKILFTCFICLLSNLIFSQTKNTHEVNKQNSTKRLDEQGEMKTYYMVFLIKGDNRSQDSITAAKIQNEHLQHLTKMYNEGKMDVAGPFLDEGDARGICIYNVATLEEAKTLAESDPAVKAGRLKVVIRPWMSMKGASLK